MLIFCNKCFEYEDYTKDNQFYISNCFHVVCRKCISANCPVCEEFYQGIAIGVEMPMELALYFENPLKLLKKAETVEKFQNDQRQIYSKQRLLKCKDSGIGKDSSMKSPTESEVMESRYIQAKERMTHCQLQQQQQKMREQQQRQQQQQQREHQEKYKEQKEPEMEGGESQNQETEEILRSSQHYRQKVYDWFKRNDQYFLSTNSIKSFES